MTRNLDLVSSTALFETATVGPRLAISRERSIDVALALHDGVESKIVICEPEAGANVSAVSASRLTGCSVGREWELPDIGLKIFEFRFGRILRRGETHVFGYDITYPGVPPEPVEKLRSVVRGFRRAVHSYTLVVRFDADARPTRVVQISQQTPQAPFRVVGELSLHDHSAHITLTGPVIGGHGLAWS
ncbi:MAG: hypothetical protein ABIP33_07295 [Pseudolysinimonas sp.]